MLKSVPWLLYEGIIFLLGITVMALGRNLWLLDNQNPNRAVEVLVAVGVAVAGIGLALSAVLVTIQRLKTGPPEHSE